MALLFFEGFELYPSGSAGGAAAIQSGQWKEANWTTSGGRTGARCVLSQSASRWTTRDLTTTGTVIVGFGWRPGGSTIFGWLVELRTGAGNRLVGLYRTSQGTVQVRNAAGSALATFEIPGGAVDTYSYIEMKATLDAAAGAVTVRVNGAPVGAWSDLDLSAGGSTTLQNVVFQEGFSGGASASHWDDIYICDDGGTAQNDFLGPIRIHALAPDGDIETDWTPNAGTSHYTQVDDQTGGHDSDSTYVASNTVGARDLYGLADLPATYQDPVAVQAYWAARHDNSSGGASMAALLKSGVTEVEGGEAALGTNYVLRGEPLHATNPDTGAAWTPAEINALQIGAIVKSNL